VIQLLEASPHSLQATTQLPEQQDTKTPTKETTPLRSVSSQDTPSSPSAGLCDTKSECGVNLFIIYLVLNRPANHRRTC